MRLLDQGPHIKEKEEAIKGPLIICRLGGVGEGSGGYFWGDHMVFREEQGGD